MKNLLATESSIISYWSESRENVPLKVKKWFQFFLNYSSMKYKNILRKNNEYEI